MPRPRRSPTLPTRSSRSRRATAWVLTGALIALSACSGGGDDRASTPDTGPVALAEGEQALPERTSWSAGTWAGRVDGTDAFVAVVAGPEGLQAYVCDDDQIGEWFRADDAAGTVSLDNGTAAMVVSPDGATLVGEVRFADGSVHGFTAESAGPDALHRAEGFDEEEVALAGWVTLPDGEVRGTIKRRSFTFTSPTLKLPTATTTTTKAPTTTTTKAPTTTTTKAPTAATTTPKATTTAPVATVKAPELVLSAPLTVPKIVEGAVPTLTLQPPSPVAPDTVAAPTPNRTTFVWAGLGDSYGSGEGAPVRPGEFTVANIPIRMPDWGTGSAGVSPDELQACHRSDLAGAPVANERLRQAYPEVVFEFAHYACSGAESYDIMNGGYDGPDRGVRVAQPAQGQRAADFAKDKGGYDAVYLSIGGNDAGFGDVIAACLTSFDVPALGMRDCQDAPPTRAADTDRGRGAQTLEQAFAGMPRGFAAIDAYLSSTERGAIPRNVLVSQYPDPTTGDGGVDCGDGNGRLAGDLLGLISQKEARWARTTVLTAMNGNVGRAAETHGWILVDGHLAAFPGHGICATDNLINTNNDSLPRQGDDYDNPGVRETLTTAAVAIGALTGGVAAPVTAIVAGLVTASSVNLSAGLAHPNAAGHAEYAGGIEARMRPLVDAKLAAGLRPPERVRVAAAEKDRRLTIRWDDKSTSEDRYEVTFTKLEGAGQVPEGVQRLPRDAQEISIDTAGGVAVRVEVKACVKDACSQPGSVEGANIIPKVPTGGTGSYVATTVVATGNVTTSANAGWLASPFATQYVIEHRQLSPTAGPTGVMTPRFPFAGIAIAEPSLGTTGNPKGRYALRIAACNRAGCSTFSPDVVVDATGEPDPVRIEPTSPLEGAILPELLVGAGGLAVLGPPIPGLVRDPISGVPTGLGGPDGSPSTSLPSPGG